MEKTLIQQNRHWNGKAFNGLVHRKLLKNLLDKRALPHIQILTGVRHCGKSTLFKMLINDLMSSGVSPKSILNVNLDAPIFIPVWDDALRLREIVKTAEKLTGVKVQYLFLDEVQQLKDWEVYVKAAYDARLFRKIYIIGSNSNLLQNGISSMLSGRYFANEVRPFSIDECLSVIGIHTPRDAYQNTSKVLRLMNNIIAYGTFPKIVLSRMSEAAKSELLQSYFDSIIRKDCIIHNFVRNTHLFYRTVNYLLSNVGNKFSHRQLGKVLGNNENTMGSYIGYLCDSYICTDIRNCSFLQKETKRSEYKCYCIDNGLMQVNTRRFTSDSGHFFENLVFNELINKGYTNISFDNGEDECKFIASRDGDIHAFQACYELTGTNRLREFDGFDMPGMPIKSKTLITFNQKKRVKDINVVPIWEWVLKK